MVIKEEARDRGRIALGPDGHRVFRCIFCHSADNQSKEHVLAEHWRKRLQLGLPYQKIDQWHLDDAGKVKYDDKPWKKREPFTWVAYTVCEPCNTGWMSSLERTAKRHLVPMVLGEEVTLDPEAICLLERWAAKTALVLESADHGVKAMTPDFAHAVMEADRDNASPHGFFTWVYAVEANKRHQMRSTPSGVVRSDHDCSGHFWRTTTVQIGAIAFRTVHTADSVAYSVVNERLMRRFDDSMISGQCLPWSLDRSRPLSVDEVMIGHVGLVEYLSNNRPLVRPEPEG